MSKLRVDLRLYAELITAGIFLPKEGLPLLGMLFYVILCWMIWILPTNCFTIYTTIWNLLTPYAYTYIVVNIFFYCNILFAGNVLTTLVTSDKEEHQNIAVLLTFCRHCGEDYMGLVLRKIRLLCDQFHVSLYTTFVYWPTCIFVVQIFQILYWSDFRT